MNLGSMSPPGGMRLNQKGEEMKVLVFEDSFDIEALLRSGGIDVNEIDLEQYWNSSKHLQIIAEINPDILLLDHFMPPHTGLQVLQNLNLAISKGAKRPKTIVAISSASMANERMIQFGADFGIRKDLLSTLELWPKIST